MKKIIKLLTVVCVSLTALGVGALTACSDKDNTNKGDDGFVNDYKFLNQYEYTDSKLKADNGITVDGVLDEDFYGNKKWLTARCCNVGAATFPGLDQTVKYTIHFSETGFVFAAEVHGNWPIRSINYDTGNTTCIESYFGFEGNDVMYEIDMTADGRFRISEMKNPVTIMTFDVETKPLYRTTIFDKNDDGEYTGYNCEAFVPYSVFGLDSAPDMVYSDVTIINWNIDERGLGTEKVWYSVAGNQSTIVSDGFKRGYIYDRDGFISYKLNIAEATGGKVEEKWGYDYIVPGNVTQIVVKPDDGMQITGLTVNGVNRIGDLYNSTNGDLVCDVTGTGDLTVVPEFCRDSQNYIISTIATEGAHYSEFAEEVSKTGVLTGKVTGDKVYGVSINGVFAPVAADGSVTVNVAELGLYEHVGLLKVQALTSDNLANCDITVSATAFDGSAINVKGKQLSLSANGLVYPLVVGNDGKLIITKLPAGEYTLSGYGLADKKVAIDGNPLNLALTQSSINSPTGAVQVENKAEDTVITITGNGEPDYTQNMYVGSVGVVAESSKYMTLSANIKIKQQNDWKASRISFFFTDSASDGLMLFTMQNGGGEFNVYQTKSYYPNAEGDRVVSKNGDLERKLYALISGQNGLDVKFVRVNDSLAIYGKIDGNWTYLGKRPISADKDTEIRIYACGNVWEVSMLRSELLEYHPEVVPTQENPNGNYAYATAADGTLYNASGKQVTLAEVSHNYGDKTVTLNGDSKVTNDQNGLTITQFGISGSYDSKSTVETRLLTENLNDVEITFTVKSDRTADWPARRFAISLTDSYNGFLMFCAGGEESNVFSLSGTDLGVEAVRYVRADEYASVMGKLYTTGIKFKAVRLGNTIEFYMEVNGSFVKLATSTISSDANTQITFLSTGDTWTFSDLEVKSL